MYPHQRPLSVQPVLAVYSGMQSSSVRVSLGWQCRLCVLSCDSLSPEPIFRFQVYVLQTFFNKTGRRYKV